MPMYYFNLKTQEGRELDPEGVELFDDVEAGEFGKDVALELMRQRETKTRFWRIEICDAERKRIDELLFASVDPLIDALSPAHRITVQQASARTAALIDTILDTRNSYYELKARLSASEGSPYVASVDGATIQKFISPKAESRNWRP
jgi:uncharacterized protein DUF6894